MASKPSVRQTLPGVWRVVRHFWPWIRHEKRVLWASAAALLGSVVLRLAEPWPLKFVLDRVMPAQRPAAASSFRVLDELQPMTLLAICALAVVGLTAFRALFDYEQRVNLARLSNRVLRRVRGHVYAHVQGLSLAFHNRSRSGDVIVRVTRDVGLLRDVVSTALVPLVGNVLILVGMMAVMLFLEWRLALLASLTLPVFWLSTARISGGIHQAARQQRKREGQMASTVAESITAIRDVKALSLEDSFLDSFAVRNAEGQKEDMKTARLTAKLGRTVEILLAVSSAGILWYGAVLVLRGSMTPGDLVVFLTYLKRAFKPARDFAKQSGRLAKGAAAGERVLSLLELEPEVQDLPDAVQATPFRGSVVFEGVDFAYDPGAPVLRGVDLRVEPGEFVALVGPSGSGKTTLISLLLRLYDPTEGRVLIDGTDVRSYTIASLRSQVNVLLQGPLLFATSIRENIACGVEAASQEQVEAAARLARADEFIRSLPEGYETVVGERGTTLSHGQRQRICIARAALRGGAFLVLDEPTTGLDEENKRLVVEALQQLAAGRTTFLITHDTRLESVADRVIRIADGKLTERALPDDPIPFDRRARRRT